jgi:quinol monooxygenase YgiN
MSEFFIVVSVYAKEGREEELRAALKAVVEPSRRDEGSLRYEMFEDRGDPRRFIFFEHWATPEAQQKHHTQSDHIRYFNEHGSNAVEKIEFFYNLNRVA